MFTLSWIVGKIYFLASLVLCSMFTGLKLPRRKNFVLRLIACVAVLLAEAALWRVMVYTNGIRGYSAVGLIDFFLQYILVVGLMWFCYDCNFWAALFCGTVGYCFEHASERMFEIIKRCGASALPLGVQYVFRTIVMVAVCAAIYFLLMRRSKYFSCAVMVDNKMQTIVAVCVIAVVTFGNSIALNFVYKIGDKELINSIAICIYAISIVFSLVAIVLEFSMSSEKNKEAELSVIKRVLHEERDRYDKEKRNIDLINIKCHDLRHQIAAYSAKLDEAEIRSISEAINIYDSGLRTGNDALDVVLNEKFPICSSNGIKLTCLVDGSRLNFFPTHEIYSLFGNAIENAINAVKDLEPEKRVISVTDAGKGRLINIRIENYYSGKIAFDGGLPVTTGDTDYHGFGMKSMRYIAEKHGGALRASVFGDIFVLEILLSEPAENKS